jgi:hypothetical protein
MRTPLERLEMIGGLDLSLGNEVAGEGEPLDAARVGRLVRYFHPEWAGRPVHETKRHQIRRAHAQYLGHLAQHFDELRPNRPVVVEDRDHGENAVESEAGEGQIGEPDPGHEDHAAQGVEADESSSRYHDRGAVTESRI